MTPKSDKLSDFLESDDSDLELSPTEYLAKQCFPLKNYQLVKIYDYHIKIMEELNNIQKCINKKIPKKVLDVEETQKLKRRATEFSIRFSRNYLYPLRMEKRQVQCILGSTKKRGNNYSEILRKKITIAYQTALQAMQTYCSWASLPENIQIGDKLKELMLEIENLHNICQNVLLPIQESVGQGGTDLLPKKCHQIIESMKKPVVVPQRKAKRIKRKLNDVNVTSSNLAMYESKLGNWSFKSQVLARHRFGEKIKARKQKKVGQVSEKAGNDNISMAKRSNDTIPSMPIRGPNRKTHKDQVKADDDLETEIQKFHLHNARTKENIAIPSPLNGKLSSLASTRTDLRSLVQEALNDLDTGDEVTAIAKLKQISLNAAKVDAKVPSNVGLFHFISEVADKQETENSMHRLNEDGMFNKFQESLQSTENEMKEAILDLPNEIADDLISYKKSLDRERKSIEKSKPWENVTRVSDMILDKILEEVLEELIDNPMLEALWKNELQNFS